LRAEIALVLVRSGPVRSGAKVGLLARRADRLTELADKIAAEGGRALAVSADVTGDLAEAVETVHAAFGRVDLVVTTRASCPSTRSPRAATTSGTG
jgi:NADP-dependent 3-hydroxy acid dehydrogenase YdfG